MENKIAFISDVNKQLANGPSRKINAQGIVVRLTKWQGMHERIRKNA